MDSPRTITASLLMTLMALTSLAGCAAGPRDDAPEAEGADQEVTGAPVLEAKLYPDPKVRPDGTCDLHTHLTVTRGSRGSLKATLENRLSGTSTCEIAVAPNPRVFTVKAGSSCGSTTYESDGTAPKIRIQDHRTRMCEDVRASVVEVEETTADGRTAALFGEPVAKTEKDEKRPMELELVDVKLYAANVARNPKCDSYRRLVVVARGTNVTATLRSELGAKSTCQVVVDPDERVYEVSQKPACGSRIYEGRNGTSEVVVEDHRARMCNDAQEHVVDVVEKTPAGTTRYVSEP